MCDVPEWLTIAEAAKLTMFSPEFIKKRLQHGDLRAYRPTGTTRGNRRIRRADLEAFMAGTAYEPLMVQQARKNPMIVLRRAA